MTKNAHGCQEIARSWKLAASHAILIGHYFYVEYSVKGMVFVKESTIVVIKKISFVLAALMGGVAFALIQSIIGNETVRLVMACVLQAALLGSMGYLLVKAARPWFRSLELTPRSTRGIAVTMLLFAVGAAVFFYFFFQSERDVKTYDSTLYWTRVIEDRALIADSIPAYVSSLRGTLGTDYNHLVILPLLLVSYITGLSFGGFCLSIALVYYLPASFLLTVFALRINKMMTGRRPGAWAFGLCFGLCALNVCLLWPVVNGFVDVAGMLVMALLFNATLHWSLIRWDIKKNVEIAILSVLLLLARGSYEFYLVGFFVAFFVMAVLDVVRGREAAGKAVGIFFANMAFMAAVCAMLFLCLNPRLFSLFLVRDYVSEYAAYKTLNLWGNLVSFAEKSGILWLVPAAGGLVVMLRSKEVRMVALRLLMAVVVAVLLLCYTQDMQVRHYYMLMPTLYVFFCAFAEFAMQYAQKQEKPIFVVGVVVIGLANFAFGYYQPLLEYSYMGEPLTTTLHYFPKRNPYYSTARHIASDLRQLIGEKTEYVYVVGDGPINNEMLQHAYLPEVVDSAPFVVRMNSADLRDGFPSQLFMADYVLLNRPYQSDFLSIQQVNFQAYDLILNDQMAKAYYEVDSTYPHADGEAILYRKARPIDTALVDNLKARIQKSYPDQPYVYEPNYFLALITPEEEVRYEYNYWTRWFVFDKEPGTPLRFAFHDTERFSTLTFQLSCWKGGLQLVVENQDGVIDQVPITKGDYVDYGFDIVGSEFVTVSIEEIYPALEIGGKLTLSFHGDSLR